MSHSAAAVGGGILPCGLAAELEARGATVTRVEHDPPKAYVHADSPDGPLFGWFSNSPAAAAAIAHEVAVRAAVGASGVLRAPPILAHGESWRLEPGLARKPVAGADAIETVVAAARELSRLELPESPGEVGYGARGTPMRLVRLATCPLAVADLFRARKLLQGSPLPAATSHGYFHLGHIFLDGNAAWVIDWESVARRPAGYDLMLLWSDLESDADRALLFDSALEALGEESRRGLLELRYALLVHLLASLFANVSAESRDPERGRRLLPLLRKARAAL